MIAISHVTNTWKGLFRRPYSTITKSTTIPNYSIYLLKSTNPYFNLSFEDWFAYLTFEMVYLPLMNCVLEGFLDTNHPTGRSF
jgi:hypothetical protein